MPLPESRRVAVAGAWVRFRRPEAFVEGHLGPSTHALREFGTDPSRFLSSRMLTGRKLKPGWSFRPIDVGLLGLWDAPVPS